MNENFYIYLYKIFSFFKPGQERKINTGLSTVIIRDWSWRKSSTTVDTSPSGGRLNLQTWLVFLRDRCVINTELSINTFSELDWKLKVVIFCRLKSGSRTGAPRKGVPWRRAMIHPRTNLIHPSDHLVPFLLQWWETSILQHPWECLLVLTAFLNIPFTIKCPQASHQFRWSLSDNILSLVWTFKLNGSKCLFRHYDSPDIRLAVYYFPTLNLLW